MKPEARHTKLKSEGKKRFFTYSRAKKEKKTKQNIKTLLLTHS